MLLEFPAPIGKLEGIGELAPTIGEFSVVCQGVVMGLSGFPQGSLGRDMVGGISGFLVVHWGLLEVCWGSSGVQGGSNRGLFV